MVLITEWLNVACYFDHNLIQTRRIAAPCEIIAFVKNAKSSVAHKIGTAGWTIPKEFANRFPNDASHLQRYARVLTGVEINSSFYRPHQATTYRRWADETHSGLSFAVKMTKDFSHEKKLEVDQDELAEWLKPVAELGEKLGALSPGRRMKRVTFSTFTV